MVQKSVLHSPVLLVLSRMFQRLRNDFTVLRPSLRRCTCAPRPPGPHHTCFSFLYQDSCA